MSPDAERFRLALAGSALTAFTMDRELRYTWMENPARGDVPDTVVGQTDADLLPPPAAAQLMALKRRVVEHGDSVAEEIAVGTGGEDLWYWLTAHPIRDAGGVIIGLAGQLTDITERKRVERASARALADLEVAQRSARLGSWSWDSSTDEGSWSAQLYEIFARDPALGPAGIDEILAYVHPEDRQRVADAYARAPDGVDPELDFRILAGDGSTRWLHAMAHEDPANPGCHRGTIQDVSAQRLADRERIHVLEELHASEELFTKGFAESPIGMALTNLDGTLRRTNATFARMLGFDDPAELAGRSWGAMTHPDDVAFKQAAVKSLLETGAQQIGEARYLARDGSVVHAIIATTLLSETRKRPAILITQVVDVTDRVRAEQAAVAREADYRRILETTLEGVWTLDADDVITFVNPAMAKLLGAEAEQLVGRPAIDFLDPTMRAEVPVQRALRRAGHGSQREVQLRGEDGRKIWALLSANPLFDADGQYAGALAMVTDISERKQMELRLRHLADHDPLTDLCNSRRLIEELDRHLDQARRSGRPVAVLIIDVDHLKVVNDTYGHTAGDALLRAVADGLRSRARATDVLARLGGDEFAVVLPDTSEHEALILAGDLRALLYERPVGPPIMTSIGVAMFSGEGELTPDEILVCADTALYEAKEHGGHQVRVYSGQASGALTWVDRIRTALGEDRFVLDGQPIIELATGQVTHQELLVRMLGDDGEIIPPAEFIPTAERFGLIHELDRWVTAAGLRLARSGQRVTINLSGQSIGEQPILDAVRAAIADGLDPANVVFEITETAALRNLAAAPLFAETLTGLGVDVALDDFGTGFGSFTYLKQIPAGYLKIDIEFVRDLVTSEIDRQVVKSIVGIAHSMGKWTIAEGVEDAETLALLRNLGVDYAQGFQIGRPARISPPTAFEVGLAHPGV